MAEAAPFEPRNILRTLVEHNVKFVVIGGLAAVFHGSPLRTGDADITPAGDRDNLERLATALTELDARVYVSGIPEGLKFDRSAETLSRGQIWNLVTKHGPLDISFVPAGTEGYKDLQRAAVARTIGGVRVQVASLLDVIRSKEAAGRPKDHAMLPTLRKLLDRITRELE